MSFTNRLAMRNLNVSYGFDDTSSLESFKQEHAAFSKARDNLTRALDSFEHFQQVTQDMFSGRAGVTAQVAKQYELCVESVLTQLGIAGVPLDELSASFESVEGDDKPAAEGKKKGIVSKIVAWIKKAIAFLVAKFKALFGKSKVVNAQAKAKMDKLFLKIETLDGELSKREGETAKGMPSISLKYIIHRDQKLYCHASDISTSMDHAGSVMTKFTGYCDRSMQLDPTREAFSKSTGPVDAVLAALGYKLEAEFPFLGETSLYQASLRISITNLGSTGLKQGSAAMSVSDIKSAAQAALQFNKHLAADIATVGRMEGELMRLETSTASKYATASDKATAAAKGMSSILKVTTALVDSLFEIIRHCESYYNNVGQALSANVECYHVKSTGSTSSGQTLGKNGVSANLDKFVDEGDARTCRAALRTELNDNRNTAANLHTAASYVKSKVKGVFEPYEEKAFARAMETDKSKWTSGTYDAAIVSFKTNFSEKRWNQLIEMRNVLREKGEDGFKAR